MLLSAALEEQKTIKKELGVRGLDLVFKRTHTHTHVYAYMKETNKLTSNLLEKERELRTGNQVVYG